MGLRKLAGPPEDTPEVDVAETVHAWSNRAAQLVDGREQREWDAGHIPGSIHVPLGQLGARSRELIREKPVVVLCAAGVRSLTGAEMLIAQGFRDVASFRGGIIAWAEAGHPIEA